MDDNLKWAFEPVKRTPYKGEIGKLEEMLDELIGYHANEAKTLKASQKQYMERMDLIEQAKAQAPPEIVVQIEKIENQLDRLRRAKDIQHKLDTELENLNNKQKNNKNIERIIEVIRVSGTKLQAKYKQEFLERMKDRELIINGLEVR